MSKIKDGYNPATWMLEVTTTAQEVNLGVERTVFYREKAAGMHSALPYAFAQVTIVIVGSTDIIFT